MPRRSVKSIEVEGNISCEQIYPVLGTNKNLTELKSVAFRLTDTQAIKLARALLAATQDWRMIDVTAFRLRKLITVTGRQDEPDEQLGSGQALRFK